MAAILSDLGLADWIGIAGSLVIVGAYLAVSQGWVQAQQPAFHLWNLFGAACLLVSLWYRPNAGAILIEVLWSLVAIAALIGWLWRRRG
jgi:hypothetical protein